MHARIASAGTLASALVQVKSENIFTRWPAYDRSFDALVTLHQILLQGLHGCPQADQRGAHQG